MAGLATVRSGNSATAGRSAFPAPPSALKVFTPAELAEATAGFHAACLIGEGGFGKVYRAMVHLTPVAIKVLDHEGLQGLREFHNEMQLLAGLNHPNVVRLVGYASGSGSGGAGPACAALVYELMTRGNLEDRLGRRGAAEPIPWAVRLRIAAQTAGALGYLHEKGIIHRDIKPANVFLDADLNAKLGDIGLAVMDGLQGSTLRLRTANRSISATNQGPNAGDNNNHQEEVVGTWLYLAPEYLQQGRCSARTDAYALGLTLLQLLAGADRPAGLVARAQAALEACDLRGQFLDALAGAWDARVAERAVKIALWLCMKDPAHRPAIAVVATQLTRLAEAAVGM